MLDWFQNYRFVIDNGLITALIVMSIFVAFNAGVMSLGSVGFMAIGGYTTAILTTKHGWPVWAAIIAGTVVGGVVAGIFGAGVLRLSGIYLALGTFALAQATIIFIQAVGFTNGVNGIAAIPRKVTTVASVGGLIVLCTGLQLIRRSHFGRATRVVRLDNVVAQGLGISARRYRTFAFVFSGVIAAYAGALEAHESTVVSPTQYNFTLMTIALTYAMIGGVEHWAGPLTAAGVLTFFREYTRDSGTDKQNLAYGILLVVVLLALPGGLADQRVLRGGRWVRDRFTGGRAQAQLDERTAGPSGGAGMSALLTVRDVSKHFQGVAALVDVDLDINPGEVLGLVGPNGAGKTTLVNAITGYIPPSQGRVMLGEQDITGLAMDKVARLGVTRTFQHLRLLDESSVLENVLQGRFQQFTVKPWTMGRTRHRQEIVQREAARQLLDELGLSTLAEVRAGLLPYGVRRRIEIARALAAEPHALLLDEPTAGMTTSDVTDIGELIRDTAASGVAVMLIEHNVSLVTRLSTRIAVLDWGKVIKVGDPESVWADENVRRAYIGTGTVAT